MRNYFYWKITEFTNTNRIKVFEASKLNFRTLNRRLRRASSATRNNNDNVKALESKNFENSEHH